MMGTASQTTPTYGGQAVLEGVMMKAPDGRMAIACRRANGEIVVEERTTNPIARRYPFLKLPILRGIVGFGEALIGGVAILEYSAQLLATDDDETEAISNWQMALAVILAFGLSVGLFIVLPTALLKFLPIEQLAGGSSVIKNLLEGCLRLTLFIGYVLLVSGMKDIRRVFEYHGAEHKAIFCYEQGLELTVENAKGFSPLHPRCGTSFMLIVMVISSLFFSLFGWPNLALRVLFRLSLLPLVAGVSYEILRLMWRLEGNAFMDLLIAPGLMLQRLTTKEPDEAQLEVAIAALERVVKKEEDDH